MSRPQNCQHRKQDGSRCGSPAMKGKRLCYFHEESRKAHPRRVAAPVLPDFPVIEGPRSVQIGLNQVIQGLLRGSIDPRTAGQILYGLQMAVGRVKSGQ
jgi:hypothetical protein